MYSLIVSTIGWDETSGTQDASRVLEYTPEDLRQRFKPNGVLDRKRGLKALLPGAVRMSRIA